MVEGGAVSININGEVGPYFKSYKGFFQGDLTSSFEFGGGQGVTQVYGILCPSRSRYMFGLLWIVEERISGYFRWGGLHPFSVRTRWAPILG